MRSTTNPGVPHRESLAQLSASEFHRMCTESNKNSRIAGDGSLQALSSVRESEPGGLRVAERIMGYSHSSGHSEADGRVWDAIRTYLRRYRNPEPRCAAIHRTDP